MAPVTILQIIPAPAGLMAVYRGTDNHVDRDPVVALALVDLGRPGDQRVRAMLTHDGGDPCFGFADERDGLLGFEMPGEVVDWHLQPTHGKQILA